MTVTGNLLVLSTPIFAPAKVRLRGANFRPDAVPFKETICGELGSESLRMKLAEIDPPVTGWKVTSTLQDRPGARLPVQPFVIWKPEPTMEGALKVIGVLPMFETVTVCGALVVPTDCVGNVRDVGETEMPDACVDPLRILTIDAIEGTPLLSTRKSM